MAKKKDERLTFDNFGKFRVRWIYDADRIVRETAELTSQPPTLNDASRRHWRRAAKLLENAAGYYGKAGLGMMAKATWNDAAACYTALELRDDYERCRRCARAIPEYYTEG